MTRRRRASAAALAALRSAFTGPALRAIIGHRDRGEIRVVSTGNVDGDDDDHIDTEGDVDAWVHTEDLLGHGFPGLSTLINPGGILFSLPDAGAICTELRPADVSTPGGSRLLYEGGGNADRWPAWAREKQGLYTWRVLRLEAREQHVEVVPGAGKKIALGASADDGSLQGVPCGVDLNTYLATLRDRINALEDALASIKESLTNHAHSSIGAPGLPAPTAVIPAHVGNPPALSVTVFAKP